MSSGTRRLVFPHAIKPSQYAIEGPYASIIAVASMSQEDACQISVLGAQRRMSYSDLP